MENTTKFTTKKLILFLVIMLFGICMYGYVAVVSYNNGTIIDKYSSINDNKSDYYKLRDGVIIEQDFAADSDMIRGVALLFDYNADRLENGTVNVDLVDSKSGELIAHAALPTSLLNNENYNCFGFDNRIYVSGRSLRIVISTEGISKASRLKLVTAALDGGTGVAMGVVTAGADEFFIVQNVVYILLVALLAIVFIYFARTDSDNKKLERIYLPVGIILGIVFSLIIPVAAAPDEIYHMDISYALSNQLMGIEETGEFLTMRYDDANYQFAIREMDRTDYNEEYRGLFAKAQNTELVSSVNVARSAPKFLYIFSALGITLGRLLGLSTVMMYLLGRWFNVLAFSLAVFYAIKKIPFGKAVVFIWAILPIMLQQSMSYSYDCIINALSILVISITLNLMYGMVYEIKKSERKDEKLPKWFRILMQPKVIILILSCILLIPCKGHALLPLSVFPVILLIKYIKNNRSKISDIRARLKPWLKWTLRIGLALACVCVVVVGAVIIRRLLATADNAKYIEWAGENGYTIGYLLKNPVQIVIILVNTLNLCGEVLFRQMIGCSLGWLDINISIIYVLPFAFLLAIASAKREGETQPITLGQKIWMWLVFVGVCGLASLGMLLEWTPISASYIAGIQGRYFLPALTLLLIPCRTRKTVVGADTDKICTYIALFLHLFVVMAILNEAM